MSDDPDSINHTIESILRHIKNVGDNCEILGKMMVDAGDIDMGIRLIANGRIHDNSKFYGVELEYLHPDIAKTKLEVAILHHNSTNPHHPEYWSHIDMMPDVFLAEAVCDWKARSEEFGTSIHEWVNEEASKRFDFKKNGPVHKKILRYLDMLCAKPFSKK